QESGWVRRLAGYPGYESPGSLVVCRESGGRAHVAGGDAGGRIHLPPMATDEARLSLAHEYLHWAFRRHPVARDERWIEGMARLLVLGEEGQ
ncbi:MAG: DUF2300 domain-containing protein, partial [Magnetococcales bacterium]|nr:DUF2300 domain-containing protein [Magnetococcales bacterium]